MAQLKEKLKMPKNMEDIRPMEGMDEMENYEDYDTSPKDDLKDRTDEELIRELKSRGLGLKDIESVMEGDDADMDVADMEYDEAGDGEEEDEEIVGPELITGHA